MDNQVGNGTKATRVRFVSAKVLLLGGGLPIVGTLACDALFPPAARWLQVPLHAVAEALGLFAAVMATEQGSKSVEAGVRQSAQTGEAITRLAESSQVAVQTAMQIAASSWQQVVGMDQIGLAMENINKVGAQTAASTTQVETAARNLHEMGQKLKVLVEQFKG